MVTKLVTVQSLLGLPWDYGKIVTLSDNDCNHSLLARNRYLVDLKDVADRHLLYPEEHAQEQELELELLRQKIRDAKELADLRDCYSTHFLL